ncbi:hypothetical protein ABVT39_014828 [Epinephelus coioides]
MLALNEQIAKVQIGVSATKDSVVDADKKIAGLLKTVGTLETKVDYLENNSRQSNRLIYGIVEAEEKNDTVAFVRRFLPEILGWDVQGDFPMQIERAHHISTLNTSRTRPIIVKFGNYQQKIKKKRKLFVLVKKKLKVTGISLTHTQKACHCWSLDTLQRAMENITSVWGGGGGGQSLHSWNIVEAEKERTFQRYECGSNQEDDEPDGLHDDALNEASDILNECHDALFNVHHHHLLDKSDDCALDERHHDPLDIPHDDALLYDDGNCDMPNLPTELLSYIIPVNTTCWHVNAWCVQQGF